MVNAPIARKVFLAFLILCTLPIAWSNYKSGVGLTLTLACEAVWILFAIFVSQMHRMMPWAEASALRFTGVMLLLLIAWYAVLVTSSVRPGPIDFVPRGWSSWFLLSCIAFAGVVHWFWFRGKRRAV